MVLVCFRVAEGSVPSTKSETMTPEVEQGEEVSTGCNPTHAHRWETCKAGNNNSSAYADNTSMMTPLPAVCND